MTNVSSGPSAGSTAVDVHAHILPRDLIEALNRRRHNGFPDIRSDGALVFGGHVTPVPPRDLTDVEERLRDMDRMGVAVQIVSPWVELSPDGSGPGESDFLRLLNGAVAAEVARHPARLRGLGLVSRRNPEEATLEMIRVARTRGMVGVEITAGGEGPALHASSWDRFWYTASELGCLVLLHPWRARCHAGVEFAGVGDIVDNPAQTSATVTALLLAGVVQRHPGLNLCLVHGGGSLPYHLGRLITLGEPQRAPQSASVAAGVARLWFDSLTHSSDALAFLVRQMGADRVLLGTDYPFATGDAEGVSRVRNARGLSAEAKAAILGGNAIRLIRRLDTL
jgi:aminocarboxymuconate-semialdehyde decarboxylase